MSQSTTAELAISAFTTGTSLPLVVPSIVDQARIPSAHQRRDSPCTRRTFRTPVTSSFLAVALCPSAETCMIIRRRHLGPRRQCLLSMDLAVNRVSCRVDLTYQPVACGRPDGVVQRRRLGIISLSPLLPLAGGHRRPDRAMQFSLRTVIMKVCYHLS